MPTEDSSSDALQAFAELVNNARNIVFFTGAGISTESGIPDFRSPGTGLWTKMKPIQFQDFVASAEVRTESWQRRFEGERVMENALPNKGHQAVANIMAQDKGLVVITQNVDNLHQAGGVADAQVIELHGNASYATCLECSTRYEMADLADQFAAQGQVAPCSRCGGIIKTATISFGQAMPAEPMALAQAAVDACDLMIVAGSSLQVFPAASFPEYAKQQGAKLVIVNREPTPLDDIADLVLHREIGETLAFVGDVN